MKTKIRFGLRTLMVAVAIVGIGIGALVLSRRASEYRLKAAEFERYERNCLYTASKIKDYLRAIQGNRASRSVQVAAQNLEGCLVMRISYRRWPTKDEMARRFVPVVPSGRIDELAGLGRDLVEYYSELSRWNASIRREYERAARYPWLPVPPDPPMPL